MKNITLFYLLILTLSHSSCYTQKEHDKEGSLALGDKQINLDSFNFKIDISQFYSGNYTTDKNAKFMVKKDTILGMDGEKTPMMIEYNQSSVTLKDTLAIWGNQPFCHINARTTIDNKLLVINTITGIISQKESNTFIDFLSRKYGQYQKKVSETGFDKFEVYLWKLNDRIIQYSPIETDMKGNADSKINNEKNGQYYEGHVYIISKDYLKLNTDFIVSGWPYLRPTN